MFLPTFLVVLRNFLQDLEYQSPSRECDLPASKYLPVDIIIEELSEHLVSPSSELALKKHTQKVLTLKCPSMTKTEFLLTISKQYQEGN